MKKVVGYHLTQIEISTLIQRCYNGIVEERQVSSFRELVDFIVRPIQDTFCVCWNLDKFSKILFSFLPEDVLKQLKSENRVWYEDVKIFSVDRLLGLTIRRNTHANFYETGEINLYSLNSWLAENRPEPDVQELESLGNQVLEALDKLSIIPENMTSPAGVYAKSLIGIMPTIFSGVDIPNLIEANDLCLDIMNLEWVKQYQSKLYAPTFTADLASAYPSLMRDLPNTDKCTVVHSKSKLACDWGILSVSKLKDVPKINPLQKMDRKEYTTEELIWLKLHGASYQIDDGYYIRFKDNYDHPYQSTVEQLWQSRQQGGILGEVSKRMMNGLSGKFSQQNFDGTYGELSNYIYSTMVTSRCRLKVAQFIEQNIHENMLVGVNVDSVCSYSKVLGLPEVVNEMGMWRSK